MAAKDMIAKAKKMSPEQIAKAEELSKEMIKKNPKLLKLLPPCASSPTSPNSIYTRAGEA